MRVKKGSFWSQTYRYTFYTNANSSTGITAAEYFIDDDPGFGMGTAIPFTADASTITFNISDLNALAEGWHSIGMRVRKGGSWSQTYFRSFLNADIEAQMQVQKIEAWWDNDLTTLTEVPFSVTDGVASVTNFAMNATGISNGKHLLRLRATADGRESIIRTYDVCKTAKPAFSIVNDAVCEGQPVYFEDLTAGADDNTLFEWDINGDGKADYTDAGGIIHTFAAAGSYTVSLTVKDGESCEETYSQVVVVNNAANPAVTLTMQSTICAGDEVTLTATPTNAGSTPQYEWLVNNRIVATTAEPTFAYSAFADGDKVAVRLTASNPCASQPVATSSEVTMTVNALPEIAITLPTTIYSDAGMITLSNYATPAGGKFYLDGATKTFFNAGTLGLGEHTLRYVVKNTSNCEAEATLTFTIAERPKYTITFVDEDGTTVLLQSLVALDAMPVPPDDPSKPADEQYTYSFAGWVPELVEATADATYTATYSAQSNPTAVDNTTVSAQARKVIEDELLYIILPDGSKYSATGAKMK
jgi:PKD repeat protein